MKLKMEAEILNRLIFTDVEGKIRVNEEYLPLAMKKYDYFSRSSSDDEETNL
jgi:hypothetical protein